MCVRVSVCIFVRHMILSHEQHCGGSCRSKLEVPKELVELVKSFHDGTRATIRVDGELLEEFEVTNGLRQGCTMATTLFNL